MTLGDAAGPGGAAEPGTLVADPPELAPDLVDALGAANAPGGGNPLATLDDVAPIVTRTLTPAEIKAMGVNDTPIELVAGEAGIVIRPLWGVAVIRPSDATYSNSEGNFELGNVAGDAQMILGLDDNLLSEAVDTLSSSSSLGAAAAVIVPVSEAVGLPLLLWVNGTSPGDGAGPIDTAEVGAAGAGYAIGDTGTIDDGTDGAYIIDTVDGGGEVLTFHLTNPGTGYNSGNPPYNTTPGGAQAGIGTGFTIAVTTDAQGTLDVIVQYRTVDVS